MKKLIIVVLVLIMTACEIMVVESDYRSSQNFLEGRYRVEEYSQTYNQYFQYEVTMRSYSYGTVWIDNFYDEGLTVKAEVRNSQLYIPIQTVSGYRIEGSGNIYSNEIRITFRATDLYSNSRTDFCESTLWKSW